MNESTPAPESSFYLAIGDGVYRSTNATRGPWDKNTQHAGPPAALLGHAIEHRPDARDNMRVTRISFTIPRPMPIGLLRVTTNVLRRGRSTEFVEATLLALDNDGAAGPVAMRAEAVLIRHADNVVPAHMAPATIPDPDGVPEKPIDFGWDVGYHTAMESRAVRGGFAENGPATVWFRMRHPLVAGLPIDPLSRVLTAADSGNGVSQLMSPYTHFFVNPELTVHLIRYPVGEWVCLDAVTHIDPGGIGLADTALHDVEGPIGRGTQSLYVAPR